MRKCTVLCCYATERETEIERIADSCFKKQKKQTSRAALLITEDIDMWA